MKNLFLLLICTLSLQSFSPEMTGSENNHDRPGVEAYEVTGDRWERSHGPGGFFERYYFHTDGTFRYERGDDECVTEFTGKYKIDGNMIRFRIKKIGYSGCTEPPLGLEKRYMPNRARIIEMDDQTITVRVGNGQITSRAITYNRTRT